ncbi:MAG: MarR family winged helix-turn-helix transcriptional regulator [Stackebrandtia sp.]
MHTHEPRPPSLLALPSYVAGQVSKYGRGIIEAALTEHGLRLEHHAIMSALRDFGPLSQQQLSRRLDLDKSHLVGHIDFLQDRELLTRSPDPDDRRRHRVELTEAGHGLITGLGPAEQRSQHEFLKTLTDGERDTLIALLRRVLQANDTAAQR